MLPERSKSIENGMGRYRLQFNFVSLLKCALVSCIQPNYVDFLRKNHLCLVFVSEISFRLEVWVLECSRKGQKRIENGMRRYRLQFNFVSLLRCALVSCIQPNYEIFAQKSLVFGFCK